VSPRRGCNSRSFPSLAQGHIKITKQQKQATKSLKGVNPLPGNEVKSSNQQSPQCPRRKNKKRKCNNMLSTQTPPSKNGKQKEIKYKMKMSAMFNVEAMRLNCTKSSVKK
jgi:hypothetical protein